MLETVRGRMTGVLADRPAVLAFQIRHQTSDKITSVAGRFPAREPGRNPAHEVLELGGSPRRVHYAADRGHRHGIVVSHKQQTLTRWPPHVRDTGKKT